MRLETLRARLTDSRIFDWMFNTSSTTDNGMKISIQGKSIEDSIFLFSKLKDYLYSNDIPFKVVTSKRYDLRDVNKEQSYKAMTIYNVDGSDFFTVCEDIYSLLIDYKGWFDIKTPTNYNHYAGGLFFRNDRDEYGNYIPSK